MARSKVVLLWAGKTFTVPLVTDKNAKGVKVMPPMDAPAKGYPFSSCSMASSPPLFAMGHGPFAGFAPPYSPPPEKNPTLTLDTGRIMVSVPVRMGVPTTVLTSTICLISSMVVFIMFSMGCAISFYLACSYVFDAQWQYL